MLKKVEFSRLGLARMLPHLIVLSFVGCAAAILAWVGWLTWVDLTNWGKDLGSIFFGSRTGEPISLGIGMTILHYFLIGMLSLSLGVILFIRNRIVAKRTEQDMWINVPKMEKKQKVSTAPAVKSNGKEENSVAREERFFSGCLHHFGYLSSRPKDSPIPQECILCQRLGDCMVATIYVKGAEKQ
jgi:hypothetical protein